MKVEGKEDDCGVSIIISKLTDVVRHTLPSQQSNDLIRRLPSAAFVAIDEEMTGISMPNTPRPRKDQTPNERYESLKAVPE